MGFKCSFDVIRAGKGVLIPLQAYQSLGLLPFKAINTVLGGYQLAAERSHGLLLRVNLFFLCQLLLVARCLQLHFSVGSFEFLLSGLVFRPLKRFLVEFRLDLSLLAFLDFKLRLCVANTGFRKLLVDLPLVQPEDAGEDLLAVSRTLRGEGISFTLQEERGIDERFIIQPERVLDFCLCGAQILFGQDLPLTLLPLVRVQDQKIELAALAARNTADNPIDLGLVFKVQLHFRFVRAGVDDGFIPLTGFAIESVGDGIQKGRFASPIRTGDTGQVKAGKINLNRLAIGSEASDAQLNRNHRHQTLIVCCILRCWQA